MRLLSRLKTLFRATGLVYAAVANKIGVSEITVKRAMSGKGLTVTMLEQLCAAVDLSVADLVELSRQDADPLPEMTAEQGRAIASDPLLFMAMFMLERKWSIDRIQQEFGIDEFKMIQCLGQLDRIGALAVFPGSRVKLLRRMNRDIRSSLSARRISHFFNSFDLFSGDNAWVSGLARLSASSFVQASQRMESMRRELLAMMERDLDLPSDKVRWYMLFAAALPVPVEELLAVGQPASTDDLEAGAGRGIASVRPR